MNQAIMIDHTLDMILYRKGTALKKNYYKYYFEFFTV